jgi:heme exporter protein A
MLEAQELAGTRGHARLFTGIGFRVEPGHALIVTGANGSGKTTLLRILAGLTAPAAGAIRWKGTLAAPFDPQLRAAVAFVGHLPALKNELSAAENLASLVALSGATASADQIDAALGAVALSKQRALPARSLSQGQRRRVGLARLSLSRHPLWILDEPGTALDSDGATLLASMVRQHLDTGGCAVIATHQPLALPPSRTATLSLG